MAGVAIAAVMVALLIAGAIRTPRELAIEEPATSCRGPGGG